MGRFIALVALVYVAAMGGLALGMRAVEKDWMLYRAANDVRNKINSWLKVGYFLPKDTVQRLAAGAPEARYTLHDGAKAERGYLLVNRMDVPNVAYVTDLIDRDGTVLHSWHVDASKINPKHIPGEFVHTAHLLPDGDLLVNFDDGKGLARLDGCANPVWAKNDQVYHHTFRPDERGGYWVVQAGTWEGGQDQRLFRFDEKTGEPLEVIDLIDDIVGQSDRNRMILKIPRDFKFDRSTGPGSKDLFHINDIEPLPAAYAAAFPGFKAGDLMIDVRNIDLVAVLDRDTHAIKWHSWGPWHMQHDPDWHEDGTITVFSNNTDRFRSAVIRIRPATGEFNEEFTNSDLRFDSFVMGEHQRLPGGNWLITSPMQGRVMQVTPEGDIVQEYNNLLAKGRTMPVPYAEFIPEGYLTKMPSCGS
jgi:hypothetical protein